MISLDEIIMILESLTELSNIRGSVVTLKDLSKVIDRLGTGFYISDKIFGDGRNPHDSVVQRLLKYLVSEGVSKNSMAVTFTEMFLETRGLAYIDFDFYMKELNLALKTQQGSESVISTDKVHLAKTIVWGITAGRSWDTGEILPFDDSILHHIRHGPNGLTLHGGFYETLKNFALVTSSENKKAEGIDKQIYEDRFINMWEMFKQGKFKEATKHWDKTLQTEYLREIKSRSYLLYWLGKI
jgi:hypothetical protein